MDKGCADHIANGTIKVKGLTTVEHFTRDGIVLGDGTEIPADVVVFACVLVFLRFHCYTDSICTRTGYVNIREIHMELFGEDVIGRTEKVWGLDEEGEINGSYRPCGYPGVRVYSHFFRRS